MEKYMYICPKCGLIYCYENNEGSACGYDGVQTIYSGFTEEEWYKKTTEERNEIKKQLTNTGKISDIKATQAKSQSEVNEKDILIQMNNNITTVKNILVFFVILTCISIIISIAGYVNIANFVNDFKLY